MPSPGVAGGSPRSWAWLQSFLLAAGYLSWRSFRLASPPKSEKIMLAVLPFQNLTGDPKQEYLATA